MKHAYHDMGMNDMKVRYLRTIAADIHRNWRQPYFGAAPYLLAMGTLDNMKDTYGLAREPASDIVAYFLSNASGWHGEDARRIKKELNQMLKELTS